MFSVAQCIKRVEDFNNDINEVEDIQKVEEIDRDITKDIERSIEKVVYVENRTNNPHKKSLVSRNQRLNKYETKDRKQKYDDKVLLPPEINLNKRDERNRRNKAASAISEPTKKYETPKLPAAKDFKAKAKTNLKLAKKDAKDVEDQTDVDGEEKVLRAAILMAEATIRTVEEMKERR